MPCNTITQVSLNMQNVSLDILKKAIEGMGFKEVFQSGNRLIWRNGSFNKDTGELRVRDEAMGARIKRACTSELVKKIGSRFGCRVKMTGQNRFQIQKG